MLEGISQIVEQRQGTIANILALLGKRPASSTYGFFILVAIVLNSLKLYSPAIILQHFFVFIVVLSLEQKWLKSLHLPQTKFQFFIVQRYWKFFFLGGMVYGGIVVFLLPTLFFLPFANPFPISYLIYFVFSFLLSLAFISPGFYKIMNETSEGVKRLISSFEQVASFTVYFFAGMSISFFAFIEYAEFTKALIQSMFIPIDLDINSLNLIIQIQLYLFNSLPAVLFVTGYFSQYFIKDGRLFLPQKKQINTAIIYSIVTLLSLILLKFIIMSVSYFIVQPIFDFLIIALIFFSFNIEAEICENCHSAKKYLPNKSDAPICYNCNVISDIQFNFKLPTFRQAKIPECPSCGKIWDEPTRQCSNCKYTVVMTCPHCGQTLNPLWRLCAKCKSPLVPIPERALTTKGYATFQKGNFFYLILSILISISLLNFLSLGFITLINFENAQIILKSKDGVFAFLFQILYIILIFLFSFFSSIFLFVWGSNRDDLPLFLIVSRYVTSYLGMLSFYVLMVIGFNLREFWMIPNLFAFGFLGYGIISQWYSLVDFVPQVSINREDWL